MATGVPEGAPAEEATAGSVAAPVEDIQVAGQVTGTYELLAPSMRASVAQEPTGRALESDDLVEPGMPPAPSEVEPVAVDPAPEAVEPEPLAVEPEPEAVEPEPLAFEPEPEAVAPEPEHQPVAAAHEPAPPPTPPTPAPPSTPTAPRDWQQSLPGPLRSVPPELLVICGLMALAGVLTLWPALKILPSIFDLLGTGGFGRDFGLLLLTVWVVLAAFGSACLLLAWRLAHADRVARGLTYVLLGGLAGSLLLGNVHDVQLTLVWIASLAAIAILALSPSTNAFFAGDGARQGDQPVPIVVARTLLAVWASCVGLVGLMFLPLGGLGGKYVVIGLVFLIIGGGGFALSSRLARADPTARLIATAGAGAFLVLLLILGRADPGLLLPLSLVIGVTFNLWIPAEAQAFFGSGLQGPVPARRAP
jgi:hypothetical protein